MLTAFQCEVIAFMSEYGDLFCTQCAHSMLDEGCLPSVEPVIRYSLDEEQTYRAEDFCAATWDDDPPYTECDCSPAIYCDECGTELVESYYDAYFHEKED